MWSTSLLLTLRTSSISVEPQFEVWNNRTKPGSMCKSLISKDGKRGMPSQSLGKDMELGTHKE